MKANKQGISLIVLVITIVVVIILAAAVILSLGDNNPIDNARIANFAQTKDGIYSAIYSYNAAVQAKTQAYYSDEEIITGTGASNASLGLTTPPAGIVEMTSEYTAAEGETAEVLGVATEYTATFANDEEKTVYKLDTTDDAGFEAEIGEPLPAVPFSGATWYVDAEGQVYLGVAAWTDVPAYMGGADDADEAKANILEDSSLAKSVVVVAAAGSST